MSIAHNPYKPGDRVRVQRGEGWLHGTIITTVLARCHVQLDHEDGDGRVVVDDYHEVKRHD